MKIREQEQIWQDHKSIKFIGIPSDTIIVSASLELTEKYAKILALYVTDGCRNNGFGKLMVNHILNKVKSNYKEYDKLYVMCHNTEQNKLFYKKLGFEYWGEAKEGDLYWMFYPISLIEK